MEQVDPYEEKLYHMFKSHDYNSDGSLDEEALTKLCKSLELNEKTNILVKGLLVQCGGEKKKVTFREFKDGLLQFLGNEMTQNDQLSSTLIADCDQTLESHGIKSPLREISPKFVVGSKKYGRRSRPQYTDPSEYSLSSDSDNEQITNTTSAIKTAKTLKVQRSASQSDIHGTKRRRPVGATKLKRCASLPAQKNPRQIEKNNQLGKTKKNTTTGTVLSPQKLDSSADSLALTSESTVVSSEIIIEMWETAGISHPNSLLTNLGFSNEQIHISELSSALDEELLSPQCGDSETSPLLKASLALHKAEVTALRQAIRQLGAENQKFYSDNKEANRRAAILAQEIDERHATLEDSTKTEIKILEQRHADALRELTSQLTTEREQWITSNSRLEARIKSFEMEENKLKTKIANLDDDKCALENEQMSLHKQITELLESNIKLNNELADMEEKFKVDEHLNSDIKNEEVLELIEKISVLQVENSNLRDKNDELTAEIESLSLEVSRIKIKKQSSRPSSFHEVPEHSEVADNIPTVDIEQNQSLAIKRRGDSPSKTRVTGESPRLGKFRKCNADDNTGTESETSGDWMALNSELMCQAVLTTATPPPATISSTSGFSQDFSSLNEIPDKEDVVKTLKYKLVQLEKELEEYKNGKDEKVLAEKKTLEDRCNELEGSLEQMRKEYEDCEDYWQGKLNEERQLYEEEQRMSDEKFNELLRKMTEYEEQFATSSEKDGRLSPITENSRLEEQFADLEAETEELKAHARKLLDDKDLEIMKLIKRMKHLEEKINNSDTISQTSPPPTLTTPIPDVESPASSPISYLWSQSTIQCPARDYQNPNWKRNEHVNSPNCDSTAWCGVKVMAEEQLNGSITRTVSPIQKPTSSKNSECGRVDNSDTISVGSCRSVGSHSVASTYNIIKSPTNIPENRCPPSPNTMKEDIKRLKMIELQLREEIKDLCHQRDTFVMEIQQLQEAKPVLEKAYAVNYRAAHPSLTSRIQQLEQKNRHLQNSLRQQNHYVETIMHQTWQQQRTEIGELRNRLDTQNIIITEQAQRLTNADILVKDLYVENAHLTATIQRLEQQRNRGMLQMQHQQGINGMTPMP